MPRAPKGHATRKSKNRIFKLAKGFRGARPFSAANKALADAGRDPIDWDPRGLPGQAG